MTADRHAPTAAPVRVLRLIDRLNVGGPTRHVVWLTAGLDRDRFATTLVTGRVADGEGDMEYFARANGVRPVTVPAMSREIGPRDLAALFSVLRLLFRYRPQIVHTHKAKAGAVGRAAVLAYRWLTPTAVWLRPRACRVVHTYHGHVLEGYYGPLKSRVFVAIERLLARLGTDVIIAISPQQFQELNGRFGVGRARQFRVIPLGMDLSSSGAPPPRPAWARTGGERVIGAVGRLCRIKNFSLLLDAAADVITSDPTTRLVIVGDGELRSDLQSKATRLGIASRVAFAGFVEGAEHLYPCFDIIALSSLNEGTPLTMIEAFNAGLAVAATEVGGVVDLMGPAVGTMDGFRVWRHGLTVSSGDARGLAAAIRWLLAHEDERRTMGETGRAFVRGTHALPRLVADVQNLYDHLLKEPPS